MFRGIFGDSRTRAGPFSNQTVNSNNAIITATNCTINGNANEVLGNGVRCASRNWIASSLTHSDGRRTRCSGK